MKEHVKGILWVKTFMAQNRGKKQRQNREGTSNHICKSKKPAQNHKKKKNNTKISELLKETHRNLLLIFIYLKAEE